MVESIRKKGNDHPSFDHIKRIRDIERQQAIRKGSIISCRQKENLFKQTEVTTVVVSN